MSAGSIPPSLSGDARIQAAVIEALRRSPEVDPAVIGVTVVGGVVSLFGVLRSVEELRAAQTVTHGVPGVLNIANEIEVRLPEIVPHADGEIAREVRHALLAHPRLPADAIAVTVAGGVVTIEGQVADAAQANAVEALVERLPGVRAVLNRLEPMGHG